MTVKHVQFWCTEVATRLGDAFLKVTALQFPADHDQNTTENLIHKFFAYCVKEHSIMAMS